MYHGEIPTEKQLGLFKELETDSYHA